MNLIDPDGKWAFWTKAKNLVYNWMGLPGAEKAEEKSSLSKDELADGTNKSEGEGIAGWIALPAIDITGTSKEDACSDGGTPDWVAMFKADRKREPYEGFWGGLEYFWTGGIENGNRYDIDGNCIGPAPVMGVPPIDMIGGIGGVASEVKATGWVAKSLFRSLPKAFQTKFANAIAKGVVAPKGQQGIIKLTATEIAEKGLAGYTHKLKILGKGGDLRIYGKMGDNSHILFDKIMRH